MQIIAGILAALALVTLAMGSWSNSIIAESESSETAPNNSERSQEEMQNTYDNFFDKLTDNSENGDDGLGGAIDKHDSPLDKGPCFTC